MSERDRVKVHASCVFISLGRCRPPVPGLRSWLCSVPFQVVHPALGASVSTVTLSNSLAFEPPGRAYVGQQVGARITSTIGELVHQITIFGNCKYSNISTESGHFVSLQAFWHRFMMYKQ